MSTKIVVLIDCLVWAVWGTAVGVLAPRVPLRMLDHDSWLTRARCFESQGRAYEKLHIRHWKGWLPDAGGWFGGRSKRNLEGGRSGLARFSAETRRAELVHWLVIAIAPVFAAWNPPPLLVVMVLYALVANVPCIVVQRYNRARIDRVLLRRSSRVGT